MSRDLKSSVTSKMAACLRDSQRMLSDDDDTNNEQPPPSLDLHTCLPPVITNTPQLPAPNQVSMRPQQAEHATPLGYQWQDMPGTTETAPARSLVPVYMETYTSSAHSSRRRARSVPAMSHAPALLPATQGFSDWSSQENVIARQNRIRQQAWNEFSSFLSQERWNELGFSSGYNRQQAGDGESSRMSQELWNGLGLSSGYTSQQAGNGASSWISQERWNEVGLASGYNRQVAGNGVSSWMSQERWNELGLASGYYSQQAGNGVSSWISQERWIEPGLASGYTSQQAENGVSSWISQERWIELGLPSGYNTQQAWNETAARMNQERWHELGLPSANSRQQAWNETSSGISQERWNEISLPSGYIRQQAGNGGSLRIHPERFNEQVVQPGFNQEGRNEVHPETYLQSEFIPRYRPIQQVVGIENLSQGSINSRSLNQQAKTGEGQAEAAFQGIPMPQYRSGHQERDASIGQSSNPQVETVATTDPWPLLSQDKAKARNCNRKTSSSNVWKNTTDTEVAAVTDLNTQVELPLKTYASAILSLAAPSAPPLVTPVKEDDAAVNVIELQELNTKKSLGATDGPKVLQDQKTKDTLGATDGPKVLQELNTKKSLGATDGPKVIQDQKTKDTLGATDGPKNVSSGSDNKYPLEPDSFFYTADMDVLMNYVGNVHPQSRMKYTEGFVKPEMASASSHKNIYDKNDPKDLPSEPPKSDMYVLEQRLKNEKAAVELMNALKIDYGILEKIGEDDGHVIYRVCQYPESESGKTCWIESHPTGPTNHELDGAFDHFGSM